MTPLEALKRIRQETCPATILPDFDKEECCNIIEEALKEKEQQDSVIKTLEHTISLGYIPPKISIDNDRMDFVGSVSLEISENLSKAKTDLIRNWILRTCFPKELKAFEILMKYPTVPLSRVMQYINNSKKYGWTAKDHKLEIYDIPYSEEEFEIMEGVLK